MSQPITIEVTVNAIIDKVWNYFTEPTHIVNWCFASDDWHCPKSENDLRIDGTFSSTMASKDGAMSFDFGGVYTEVVNHQKIAYTLGDGRKVVVVFEQTGNETKLTETFDPENTNPLEMQKAGWQAILNNFKKYVEAN